MEKRKCLGKIYLILSEYLLKYREPHAENIISRKAIILILARLFHVKGAFQRYQIINELCDCGYIELYKKKRDGVYYKVLIANPEKE